MLRMFQFSLVPWKILQFLIILVGLVMLLAIEFSVSLPVLTASLFVSALLRVQRFEAWALIVFLSLVTATLYMVSWPLVLSLFVLWYGIVRRFTHSLVHQPLRILSLGLTLGVLPAVLLDVVVTERVMGLTLLGILGAFVLVWLSHNRRSRSYRA